MSSYFVHESSYIDEDVELKDGVFCGPSCVFTNGLPPASTIPKASKTILLRKP